MLSVTVLGFLHSEKRQLSIHGALYLNDRLACARPCKSAIKALMQSRPLVSSWQVQRQRTKASRLVRHVFREIMERYVADHVGRAALRCAAKSLGIP